MLETFIACKTDNTSLPKIPCHAAEGQKPKLSPPTVAALLLCTQHRNHSPHSTAHCISCTTYHGNLMPNNRKGPGCQYDISSNQSFHSCSFNRSILVANCFFENAALLTSRLEERYTNCETMDFIHAHFPLLSHHSQLLEPRTHPTHTTTGMSFLLKLGNLDHNMIRCFSHPDNVPLVQSIPSIPCPQWHSLEGIHTLCPRVK